uniref:F-box associated domain-containing protein n=1 Tax=Oryza meridionalis TaxID=40149 RepID=A0A0E0EMX7_9ORYZ
MPPPPSYPVCHLQTAIHSRGNLFWKLELRRSPAAAAGSFLLLRFNLTHETFTVVHHPRPSSQLAPPLLSELDGELCLGLLVSGRQELWVYSNNGGAGDGRWQWERRFSIAVSGPEAMYLPLGVLRRHDRLLLQKAVHLYHHDSGGGEESVMEVARMDEFDFEWSFPGEPYAFMVIPYTESLVRVSATRPINKAAATAGETAAMTTTTMAALESPVAMATTTMAALERPKRARRANSRYIGDMWDV